MLERCGFSSSPTGCPVPSAWHALPCECEGLAQLSCICAQLLVLFSYEMLSWEGRGSQGQRALPGAGVVQQPEGKRLALAGRGSELSNTSPSSKAVPGQSRKEQAGERRGIAPVTFPFVQALQEWLELLLIEDCALRVPLPQHHPSLLQPGDLKVDGADGAGGAGDGGCWGQHSPWTPGVGLAGCSQGAQAGPRAMAPSCACCSPKQPPSPALTARDSTSLALRLRSGFLSPPHAPGQQLPHIAAALKMRRREGAAVPPPLCRQEARLPSWARFKIEF